jgi:hypothetical protein
MNGDSIFRVTVKHNLVCAVERVPPDAGIEIPDSKLEVSTQVARNHQANGCLDGQYYFSDAEQAKNFSLLCLDFVNKLVERAIKTLEKRDFRRDPDWHGDSQSTH